MGSMDILFEPVTVGTLTLRNRIVMAPMTRLRSPDDTPNSLVETYYRQRAGSGLIVTECTMVSETSAAYINAPGIYHDRFIDPWARVVRGVHEAGGRIFLQLWHSGRVGHSSLQPDRGPPLAPSAIAGEGDLHTYEGKQPLSVPRPLTREEVKSLIKAFGVAAARAARAGFDGVEIHGAFGYLIDQFLQDGSNHRADEFGGTIENRARFLFAVIAVAQQAFGANVGVKLSPSNRYHGMSDSAPAESFGWLLKKLDELDLAYVHMMEPLPFDREKGCAIDQVRAFARRHYKGTIIANGGLTPELATTAIESGEADLASFGQLFIANPDLPERIRAGHPLATPDFATVYGIPGTPPERGYIDYPRAT